MTKCPLTSKLLNEEISLAETRGAVLFLIKSTGKLLTREEFYACIDNDMLFEPKLVFGIATEPQKPKLSKNLTKLSTENTLEDKISFFSEYSKPEFKLEYTPVMYKATQVTTVPKNTNNSSYGDVFVGLAATAALAMSAIQQIKKKKEQLENQKCCSESKISINKLETDITKLKTELETKTKESSKALHAEIYEQYKEIKEMREDAENIKDIVSKLVDIKSK